MKKEEDKKLVLMQCRVNRETAERVDHICKRCGIASRYELMGYLLSCFMRYADPQTEADRTSDIMELGHIFDGFDDPTTRIVTVGTTKGMQVATTVRYLTQKGKKARAAMMYDHTTGMETSNTLDILDTTMQSLFPSLHRRLEDIGRQRGFVTDKEVIEDLANEADGIDEAWHTISTEMEENMNNITYGRVPKRTRTPNTEEEG